jgi:endoglucanase
LIASVALLLAMGACAKDPDYGPSSGGSFDPRNVDGGADGGVASAMGAGPVGTPVWWFGQLSVCGTRICDALGRPVQLKGPSSMWLNWEDDGYAQSRSALAWMRDNWHLSVIRAAMGVEPGGAYLADPMSSLNQVRTIIKNAIAEGVYVIVDWHDHNAHMHQAQSAAFFAMLAEEFKDAPNVLWETFNEPLQVSWPAVLKPYHTAIVAAIRAHDLDNIIIMGTAQWSQRVDEAAASPVQGANLMYTLHFYSCSHDAVGRGMGDAAIAKGLAIFVTEWGATNADGGRDGKLCLDEAQKWMSWMNQRGISWTAWKLDDCKPDSSCLLKEGAPLSGGWTDEWLFGHGAFVRDHMRQ